tara:strand:+ start:1167 stop:2210 length:1044 start_codon:yes stop_codon:yes gene_type:complete
MPDLRSDTVTKPTPLMWEAMQNSQIGDDVLGDDPTVIELEQKIAQLLGHEAGCFVPSGTMANQIAIHLLTKPGDELILHKDTHVFYYESGAPAALSGVSMNFVDGEKGFFTKEDVSNAIRPDDNHYPTSKLVIVENTHNRGGGSVWTLPMISRITDHSRAHGLACHLDGARLFNASIASGNSLRSYGTLFDTVSVCFSKGLGCPVGSALVSSKKNIKEAKRIRKRLGGTMRQSGLLAGAAIWALNNHIDRLDEDHKKAKEIAEACALIPGLSVNLTSIQTNIVFISLDDTMPNAKLCRQFLETLGTRVLDLGAKNLRAVTHLNIKDTDVKNAINSFKKLSSEKRRDV